jgi:hypothetical protein
VRFDERFTARRILSHSADPGVELNGNDSHLFFFRQIRWNFLQPFSQRIEFADFFA